MIVVALIFILDPSDDAYVFVIAVLTLGLLIRGLKDIIFYFTMARHMVGGKMILFQGVIVLDFALLTGSLSDVPKIYILLYLVVIHAFSGVVEILRAMEARRTVSGPWKMKFTHGIVDFLLYLHQTDVYCTHHIQYRAFVLRGDAYSKFLKKDYIYPYRVKKGELTSHYRIICCRLSINLILDNDNTPVIVSYKPLMRSE